MSRALRQAHRAAAWRISSSKTTGSKFLGKMKTPAGDGESGGHSMKIIGAGLPRTATLTQKISLEILGIAPCYHMVNVLADLSLAPQWAAAFDGSADWDSIFAGHQATVDWPGSFFWRELIDYYPQAKVLLSVREGQGWATSLPDTI